MADLDEALRSNCLLTGEDCPRELLILNHHRLGCRPGGGDNASGVMFVSLSLYSGELRQTADDDETKEVMPFLMFSTPFCGTVEPSWVPDDPDRPCQRLFPSSFIWQSTGIQAHTA